MHRLIRFCRYALARLACGRPWHLLCTNLLLESVHWYGEADARTSSCASSGTGGMERGASGLGSQAEAEAHYRGPMSRGGACGLKATGK